MTTVMTSRRYVVIWMWLAGLMLLGVALSFLHIPHRTVILLVLGLSTIKAILVGAYYMHLKFDSWFLTLLALSPIPLGLLFAAAVLLDRPFLLR